MQDEADTQRRVARQKLIDAMAVAASGDTSAIKTIYDMTSAKLFGICLHICGNREAAEDVLQDVYVKIWRRATSFDAARASPISWMAIIARNASFDWCRREARGTEFSDDALAMIVDDTPLADTLLEQVEMQKRLANCLERLSADQSGAIRLAFLEGRTYQQLSHDQGTPVGTLKSWVRRGIAQLKACLGDD